MSDEIICCQEEINHLEKSIEDLANKLKDLKQTYEKLLIENLKKDIILRQIKKKINQSTVPNNNS